MRFFSPAILCILIAPLPGRADVYSEFENALRHKKVETILETLKNPNFDPNQLMKGRHVKGMTYLGFAILNTHNGYVPKKSVRIIRALLDDPRVDLNTVFQFKRGPWNATFMAIFKEQPSTLKALVNRDADLSFHRGRQTALDYAIRNVDGIEGDNALSNSLKPRYHFGQFSTEPDEIILGALKAKGAPSCRDGTVDCSGNW